MHEASGVEPTLVRFARFVAEAGFTVVLPNLFREIRKNDARAWGAMNTFAGFCVSREFSVFASNRSSPIVYWLKALAAHQFPRHGGRGVGVIGMCFTGNFGKLMMVEAAMRAAVMSQPSLPVFPSGSSHFP